MRRDESSLPARHLAGPNTWIQGVAAHFTYTAPPEQHNGSHQHRYTSSSPLLSSCPHVTTPHTTLAPHIISLSLATLCFEKSSALSPPKSPKSPSTHPRKNKGKVIKKGGKAAATFFLTMTAVAVDKKQSAKDCQRMMSEVKGEDGAKGDRDARIAGAIGKGVGTVAKTGLKMATSSIPGLYTSRWIGGVY